jgi:hypothetical protein
VFGASVGFMTLTVLLSLVTERSTQDSSANPRSSAEASHGLLPDNQ